MEKIEVGYRNIGSFGGVEYYHKFLLYTDNTGNQNSNMLVNFIKPISNNSLYKANLKKMA